MANPIKLSDLNQTKFYQLPKAFFHNPIYMDMKTDSKVAYSLLRDLLDLSIQNHWVNENNEVYVKLSRNKLMSYLNIKGTQKIVQIMKELTDKELIIEKQVGLKKCNEIYVCIPEELEIIYDDAELLEKDTVQSDVNVKENVNGVLKIKSQEFRKSKVKSFENQKHIKTNTIKTNNINTNNKKKKEEKKVHKGYKAIIEEYTNNLELNQTIYAFIEMRKANKSTLTDRALTMLLNKLDKLATNDLDKIEILNNSIMKSYKSIFPLEEQKTNRSLTKAATTDKKQSSGKHLKFNDFEQRPYSSEDDRFREVQFGFVDIASIDRDKLVVCINEYDKYIKDNNINLKWQKESVNDIECEQRVLTPYDTEKSNTGENKEELSDVEKDMLKVLAK